MTEIDIDSILSTVTADDLADRARRNELADMFEDIGEYRVAHAHREIALDGMIIAQQKAMNNFIATRYWHPEIHERLIAAHPIVQSNYSHVPGAYGCICQDGSTWTASGEKDPSEWEQARLMASEMVRRLEHSVESHARGDRYPINWYKTPEQITAAIEAIAILAPSLRSRAKRASAALTGLQDVAREEQRQTNTQSDEYVAMHARRVARVVAACHAESKASYAQRRVSDGYWALQRARLLQAHPGYVCVRVGDVDMRQTPPAGEIWIKPATSGRWGKARRQKFGRPLRLNELAAEAI